MNTQYQQYYITNTGLIYTVCLQPSYSKTNTKYKEIAYIIFDPENKKSAGAPYDILLHNHICNTQISQEDINLFFASREDFFITCAYYYI